VRQGVHDFGLDRHHGRDTHFFRARRVIPPPCHHPQAAPFDVNVDLVEFAVGHFARRRVADQVVRAGIRNHLVEMFRVIVRVVDGAATRLVREAAQHHISAEFAAAQRPRVERVNGDVAAIG
jgi:hypothetical protein